MRGLLLLANCCFASIVCASDPLKQTLKEGQKWGKDGSKFAIEQAKDFSIEDLKPPGKEEFDPKNAKSQIKHGEIPQTETLEFLVSPEVQKNERENRRFNEDEYFIKRSEEIASGSEQSISGIVEEEVVDHSYEICQEAEAPYPISLVRNLVVDIEHVPEEKKEVLVCQGHKTKTHFYWKSDAEDWVKNKEKKFSKDPTIKTYRAYIDNKGKGVTEKYCVRAEWTHVDDAATCEKSKNELKVVEPERTEEKSEKWVSEDETLLAMSSSPDCVLIEKACLDASPKVMFGKEIHKQCWKEQLSYLCQLPKSKQCLILREKNCEEVKRKCLKESSHGCALWEVTYKCFGKIARRQKLQNEAEMLGSTDDWEVAYEPNQSFADVYTKMAVFEEIKLQLEAQDIPDASKVQLFKGKEMTCSKNVADKLVYDCCFAYGGLANKFKLSQCSEKEISLGEMREKGLCHYVGKYEEKMLDLWKSSDVHVFCCFPTKLARVFQEEVREQLQMDWGKAKGPNCRGFLENEIAQVDFSRLNLSEVYDKQTKELEQRLEQKLQSVTAQLQERMKAEK